MTYQLPLQAGTNTKVQGPHDMELLPDGWHPESGF
jgi:hypothetical protein